MGRSTVESIGKSSAILAAVEVGLGSFLHGLRVPFAGKLLSLNQTFLLSWFSRNHPESDRGFAAEISAITALLKSLSPMGKKLTPMLGISTQGLLFSFGVFICGNNIIGSVLGSILAGTWAFIQPILLYFLIYGATLFKVVDFYIQAAKKWFPVSPQNLLWAVAILVIIKLFLHAVLALAAWSFKSDKIESYVSKISRAHKKWGLSNPKTLIQGIKSDLTQPFFMFSLLLTSVFLIFSESDRTRVILGVLKPLATAFLCFLCIRLLPLEKIKSESLKRALKYLKGI
jgi:hypothetical protein